MSTSPSLTLRPASLRVLLCGGLLLAAGRGGSAEPTAQRAPERPLTVEEEFAQLASIRVTSVTRTASTVAHSPAAISVITQEDIRRSGATTLPELLRGVPGLHVARIDGNKWAVASRGFNSRFAKNLLVQIDGRSVYNPQTAGVFWDAVDYPLEDIERIEVIRGPGASVWGANAVNGVINITTKRAQDTQGGLVSAGGGIEERGFGTLRYGGKIRDDLFFRLFGKGFDHDRQFSPEGDPNDGWWGASGGMRLEWTPSLRDTLTLNAGFGRSVGGTKDRFAQATADPVTGLFAPTIAQDETTDTGHVLGLWNRQLDADSGWKLQAFWDRWQRTAPMGLRDTRFDTYDLDFQHQFSFGERQKLVWGLGHRYVDADLKDSQNDGAFSLDWLNNESHMQVFSAFVQDEIALVKDLLSLTLGSKFEHNNFTGFEVQPSARLLWTPTERQSVWAAASRAVRTPSFTENEAQFTIPNANPSTNATARVVANRSLRPEEVWAYELGYRVQATDAFSVDTALFYNVHNDLRINRGNSTLTNTLPSPLTVASQFQNGMGGETYGAELGAHWRVSDRWRLYAAYTFLEIQLHRAAGLPASAEAAEGQDPQQQIYVQSSWNLPRNVEVDLTGRFVDRLKGFNPAGIAGVSDTVDAYFALDARLAWRPRRNLELAIIGQNLLDNRHPENGTNPFIRSPLVEIERSVYGKVTWRF